MEARRIIFYSTLSFSVVLEYLVRTYDWWPQLGGHMDSVMHFFWGLNIFLLSIVWLRWKPVSAFYGVFAFQMAWELVEMIGDNDRSCQPQPRHPRSFGCAEGRNFPF